MAKMAQGEREMTRKQNHNEECFVLLGKRRSTGRWRACKTNYSVGEPCSVNFNPEWVIEREESHGDIIGWWHTHPNTIASPSMTDYATMHAWVCSFGKPMLCCIDGVDGLRAHWFFDDETEHVEGITKRYGSFFWGVVPEWTKPEPTIVTPEVDLITREEYDESFEELNEIQKGVIYGE
jgi:proteasome lid subunit RPN8/RPN11